MSNKSYKIAIISAIIITLIFLFLIQVNLSNAQNVVPYRIRMPSETYSAQLRGVTGTRAAGLTISGSYSATFKAHQFTVTIAGYYDLWFDAAGGTNFSKDASWSGANGKFIPSGYFDDAIDTDLDYKVDQIDDNVITTNNILDSTITQSDLSQALQNFIGSGGNITNNPDDETIINVAPTNLGVNQIWRDTTSAGNQNWKLIRTAAELATYSAQDTISMLVTDSIRWSSGSINAKQISFTKNGKLDVGGDTLEIRAAIPMEVDWQIFDFDTTANGDPDGLVRFRSNEMQAVKAVWWGCPNDLTEPCNKYIKAAIESRKDVILPAARLAVDGTKPWRLKYFGQDFIGAGLSDGTPSSFLNNDAIGTRFFMSGSGTADTFMVVDTKYWHEISGFRLGGNGFTKNNWSDSTWTNQSGNIWYVTSGNGRDMDLTSILYLDTGTGRISGDYKISNKGNLVNQHDYCFVDDSLFLYSSSDPSTYYSTEISIGTGSEYEVEWGDIADANSAVGIYITGDGDYTKIYDVWIEDILAKDNAGTAIKYVGSDEPILVSMERIYLNDSDINIFIHNGRMLDIRNSAILNGQRANLKITGGALNFYSASCQWETSEADTNLWLDVYAASFKNINIEQGNTEVPIFITNNEAGLCNVTFENSRIVAAGGNKCFVFDPGEDSDMYVKIENCDLEFTGSDSWVPFFNGYENDNLVLTIEGGNIEYYTDDAQHNIVGIIDLKDLPARGYHRHDYAIQSNLRVGEEFGLKPSLSDIYMYDEGAAGDETTPPENRFSLTGSHLDSLMAEDTDLDSFQLGTADFTISFWFLADTGVSFIGTTSGDPWWYMNLDIVEGRLFARFDNSSTGGADVTVYTEADGYDYWDSRWHHMAVSADRSDSIRLYVDGVRYNGGAGAATRAMNASSMDIGATDQFFMLYGWGSLLSKRKAYMDDLVIWRKALSDSEIDTVYNNGAPCDYNTYPAGAVSSLAEWFDFETTSVDSVFGSLHPSNNVVVGNEPTEPLFSGSTPGNDLIMRLDSDAQDTDPFELNRYGEMNVHELLLQGVFRFIVHNDSVWVVSGNDSTNIMR